MIFESVLSFRISAATSTPSISGIFRFRIVTLISSRFFLNISIPVFPFFAVKTVNPAGWIIFLIKSRIMSSSSITRILPEISHLSKGIFLCWISDPDCVCSGKKIVNLLPEAGLLSTFRAPLCKFCGEKGIEYPRHSLLIHADSFINDFNIGKSRFRNAFHVCRFVKSSIVTYY